MSDFEISSRILFADRHLVVVDKPARLLVASDQTGDVTLLELVRAWHATQLAEGRKGYLVPIHFLDRPVSGVVMFARSSKAASRLNEQFRSRKVEKEYRAIVDGRPRTGPQRLEDYLLKDRELNRTVVASVARNALTEQNVPGKPKDGKLSVLTYEYLEAWGHFSLLKVMPETGRSHQIRVQLSHRGLPIYGDKKYGSNFELGGTIALHAFRLTVRHPITQERMTWQSELPGIWQEIKKDGL